MAHKVHRSSKISLKGEVLSFDENANSGSSNEGRNINDLIDELKDTDGLVKLTLYPLSKLPPSRERERATEHFNAQSQDISPHSKETMAIRIPSSLPKLLTKSFLPFCALFLLSQKPRYGNELILWLKEKADLWSASPGTVYPLLQQLEHDGLIQGRWEPGVKRPRHVYAITDKGKIAFENLRAVILPRLKRALTLMEQLLEEIRAPQP